MIKGLIPYNSNLIPVINKNFSIKLPRNSDIVVNKGDKLTLKDSLASYESSPILESFDLEGLSWDFGVLQGEFISVGEVIAQRKTFLIKEEDVLIASQSGIVDLSVKDKVLIREDFKDDFVRSGFSGEVLSVDRLNNYINVNIKGSGFSPLFVHNLPLFYSYLLRKNDSEIKLFFHKDKNDIDLKSILRFDGLIIIDYLTQSEFDCIIENLDKFDKGVCVMTNKKNKFKIDLVHRLFEKLDNNRLFVNNNLLFSTLWKSKLKDYRYASVRSGSRVVVNLFNKIQISGKIISSKGLYLLIETDDKKQRYVHYLNVFKE